MKNLIVLALLVFSANSFARSLAPLVCDNGKIGEDSYLRISTVAGNVEFQMHESFISVRSDQSTVSGNSIVIQNKTVKGNAEGESFRSVVNALLVFNSKAKTVNVTLVLDGNAQIPAVTLKCK